MKKNFETYIKHFIVEVKPQMQWNSYDDCFKECLKEIKKHYDKWSENGYSYQEKYKNDLENIAKRRADLLWVTVKMSVKYIEINDEYLEKSILSMVENRKDFVRWFNK